MTVVDGWGRARPEKELELPSGSRVRVRELSVMEIVTLGIVDKIDAFTAKALPKSPKNKAKREEAEGLAIFKDKDRMGTIMEIVDKIAVVTVVAPKVYPEPPEGESLDPDKIYVHLVPLADKMVIFEHSFEAMDSFLNAGGEQEPDVGAIPEVQIPEVFAQPNASGGSPSPRILS